MAVSSWADSYSNAVFRLLTHLTGPKQVLCLQSPLSNGLFAGKWCSYSTAADLPHDQREEEGGALVFTSAPLDTALEIMGAAVMELELSASKPVAMIAVRLSDVHPDNKSSRVTYGLLNLTHRDSHAKPTPLQPDKRYRVRVQLNGVAQTFPRATVFALQFLSLISRWPGLQVRQRRSRFTQVTAA
ncbi:MAG: putative acyl esterase [Paraglaciecola sp.]|jgi:predicted acyl esterase